jgi:hypothetical protein
MINGVAEAMGRIQFRRLDSDGGLAGDGLPDLTFLATGECQHVFAATGEEDAQWVYKIPAAFGYLLPSSHPSRKSFKPKSRSQQLVRLALVTLPAAVHKRGSALSARLGTRLARGGESALLRSFDRCALMPKALGESLLRRYVLWERVSRFNRMLRTLDLMRAMGLSDVVLPHRIIRKGMAVLRVNGCTYRYEGPFLVQRKAEFFDKSRNFKSFPWEDLITQQQLMWRHGIALDGPAEVLGPKNWALMDGRLRLGDTSGLTTDLKWALRAIKAARLDRKEKNVVCDAKSVNPDDPAEEYFRETRKEINEEKLRQLWRSAVD